MSKNSKNVFHYLHPHLKKPGLSPILKLIFKIIHGTRSKQQIYRHFGCIMPSYGSLRYQSWLDFNSIGVYLTSQGITCMYGIKISINCMDWHCFRKASREKADHSIVVNSECEIYSHIFVFMLFGNKTGFVRPGNIFSALHLSVFG